jgi:DNA-binding NtrC family response regulator
MKTVLFVDDEPSVLNALRRAFMDTDLCCLFAASAEDALAMVQREPVWVVVSDNSMPGMKGIDFLSRLKLISPDTVRIMAPPLPPSTRAKLSGSSLSPGMTGS